MLQSKGYAAQSSESALAPFSFERRDPDPADVQMEILFCGVCHSDLHMVRNEWMSSEYPLVPGHEIIGRVVKVGENVTRFKPGDIAAVGCMVNSCRECTNCRDGLEQYCLKGCTLTYSSPDPKGPGYTMGGYSSNLVADEAFVLKVPGNLNPAAAAPLLCAGITTYSPLRHWKVGNGSKVGVVGLGGLGHMAIKFAHAFGADVTLFTTSPGKAEDAKRLGAARIVISKDEAAMQAEASQYDFVLNTVSAKIDLSPYINLLKREGTMTLVGAPAEPPPLAVFPLITQRRNVAGSMIGGIRETQEMLDFCGQHNIVSDVEVIPINMINQAYERMLKSDVKYRFVIDMTTL